MLKSYLFLIQVSNIKRILSGIFRKFTEKSGDKSMNSQRRKETKILTAVFLFLHDGLLETCERLS